ncbi:MAG: hypothetical protein HGA45_10390 [Chloroflexales bacterium]|nr:hypothetical protein [Chloroflexales bacterium]
MRFSQARRLALTMPAAVVAAYAAVDAQTKDSPRPHPRARALLHAPFLPWLWEAGIAQDTTLPHHELIVGLLCGATRRGARVMIITGDHQISLDLAAKLPALALEHDQIEVSITTIGPLKRGLALLSPPAPKVQALVDSSRDHVILIEQIISKRLRAQFDHIVLVGVELRAWEMVRMQNPRSPVGVVLYEDTASAASYQRTVSDLSWTELSFIAASLPQKAASTAV